MLFIGQRTGPDVLIALGTAGLGAIWVIFRADTQALLSFDIGRGELIFLARVIGHAAYVPLQTAPVHHIGLMKTRQKCGS